jgi:hypothetical protein
MIRHLFELYAASPLGQAIRNSSWDFALLEMVHLFALALLGGGLLVAAIGLFGRWLQFPARADGWRGLRAFLAWSLAATVTSGALLVGVNPLKYYFNDAFRVKMLLLAVALALAILTDFLAGRRGRIAALTGLATLAAWLAVATAGRLIGLL